VVSEQEFVNELRRMNQRYSQQFGEQWNEIRDQVDLPGQTVSYFIGRELQLAEASDAGLVVSEQELQERISADPIFQRQEGGFIGGDRYQRIVRSYFQMSPREFERWYEENVLLEKLGSMLANGVYVSNANIEDRFRRQRETADFDVIQLRYEPFLSEVSVEEADIRSHYELHAEDYRRPEQRVIRYLLVETSRLRRLLPVEEPALEEYYEQNRESFMEEEQAHARHILFMVSPDASAADRAEAKLRAESVTKIARGDADFSELAAKHSDDPGSKDSGGDLGWFGRGRMVKEFEEAVFSAKPGDLIGPVESQFGFHIIRIEGFKPQRQQPFDEVRDQVRFQYLEGRAAAEAEVRAAELARRLASESPEDEDAWQKIADEDEAVVLNLSPPFGVDDVIPGTGGGTELATEVFDAKLDVIGGPRAIPRGWMVWQLNQIRPEGVPPFEDVRGEVEQRLRRERALELAAASAAELGERLRSGGDHAELADDFGGTVFEARDHRRGASVPGIGGAIALDDAIFGASEEAVVGPISLGDRGIILAKIQRLELVDSAELDENKDQVRASLRSERAQNLLQSMLIERRRNTVVTVNNEFMERFAPVPDAP
jgi:peptidyl-prolyl cis-trans isomerase D